MLAQAARLQALQSQLQPHFLFNSLNSISALIVDGRLDAATSMISRLSDFLRLSLQTSETPQVAVARRWSSSAITSISRRSGSATAEIPTRCRSGRAVRADANPAAAAARRERRPTWNPAPQRRRIVTIAVHADARTLKLRIEDDGAGLRNRQRLHSVSASPIRPEAR